MPAVPTVIPTAALAGYIDALQVIEMMEARVGIEPTHTGFADLECVGGSSLISATLIATRSFCPLFVHLAVLRRSASKRPANGEA